MTKPLQTSFVEFWIGSYVRTNGNVVLVLE